jgi:tetratricopeptide (TPR) repeat protein
VQTGDRAVSLDSFVGRTFEVEALVARGDEARHGRGSVVLVGGEPGIGKTRLVEEFTDSAARSGMRVLWGSCWPGEGGPSFWPWIQVLRAYGRDPDARALLSGTPQAGDVARLVPELFPAPLEPMEQVLDPDQQRFRMFDSLTSLLRKAGDARPAVVVLDDLHWADPSTLDFLRFLSREVRDTRILVIGTYREAETKPDHPLLQLPHDVQRLTLAGLSASDTGALISAITGVDADPGFVETTHRRTGGNPFYIREMARLLGRSAQAIPATVREAVKSGLAPLSPEALRALSAASVAGPEFEAGVLARAIGSDPAAVRAVLDEAVAARIVVEKQRLVGRYGFAHDLVRETLLEELGPAEQARMHGSIGDAIEAVAAGDIDARVAELAHHFLKALPEHRPKAIEYSIRAGHRALGQLLYAEAMEDFGRALDLSEGERRLDLLIVFGDAAVRAGQWSRATEAYVAAADLARRLGRPHQLARAALGLGAGLGGFEVRLFDQRQIDLLEEALGVLPEDDSALRAWVMARLAVALSFVGSEERRKDLAREAVGMARRVADPAALAYALSTYCDTIATPEHHRERMAASEEMVRLAREAGDRELELLAHRFRVEALFQAGDIPGLDAEIAAYASLAEVLRQPISHWYVPLFRGARALMEGRFQDSERLARQALEMGERAQSTNATMMADYTLLTEAFRQAGRFEEMEVQWQRFVEAFPDMASVADWIAFALATVGQGNQAKARADLERLTASGAVTALGGGGMWIVMTVFMAEVAAGVHSVAAAEVLYEALRPFGPQFVICGTAGATYGSVWRHLALLADVLGRHDEAAEHFERAIDAHRAAGALPYLAHTQREFAAMLLRTGRADDRERASGLLAEAIDTYERLGMEPWLHRAQAMTEAPAAANEFRREGDVWTLAYGDRAVRLKDAKGLRDLAVLLRRPGTEVHCSELLAAAEGAMPGARSKRDWAEAGLAQGTAGGYEVLDRQAQEAYRKRLVELREELEEAEDANDIERAARARSEMDVLAGELASALGLGGRSRKTGDPTERARKAVTERIRAVIKRIEQTHPPLGHHLRHSIRTGAFCSYRPEVPMDWSL